MTTPDTTITRATIIAVLQTIAPFIKHIDSEKLLDAAIKTNGDFTFEQWRTLAQSMPVFITQQSPFALLTLVTEHALIDGGAADWITANPPVSTERMTFSIRNGASNSPSPLVGEGAGGEGSFTTLTFTHVERGESKGSGSPKWEFKNDAGERYWAFAHHKPERNTIPLFVDAGYTDLMDMQLGDVQRWQKHPIVIEAIKEGDFWKAVTVQPKPEGAKPDSSLLDKITPEKRSALLLFAALNKGMLDNKEIVVIDVETTGTTDKDEIVEFAGVNLATGEVYETLISTHDNGRINAVTHLNGITEEMLNAASTPKFEHVALNIEDFLRGEIIVAHNREFEMRMLRQTWEQHERPYPVEWSEEHPEHDTMQIMSMLVSDPGYKQGEKRWIGLDEARKLLQIETVQTHRAMPDVQLTIAVIGAAALLYRDLPTQDMDDIPF